MERASALKILTLSLVGAVNLALLADDPNCSKKCGAGMALQSFHRTCTGGVCHVTLCTSHVQGCGFEDNFNDICGSDLHICYFC